MKKLTLEHWSTYFPFQLKGIITSDKQDDFDDFSEYDWFDENKFKKGAIWTLCGYADGDLNIPLGEGEFDGLLWRNEHTYVNFHGGIKLILKPLSNLIDNILDDGNDENYNLSCELAGLLNTNDCSHFVKALIQNKYYSVDVRLWKDIEDWLSKNHFDWKHNLIGNGFAIDINTVK